MSNTATQLIAGAAHFIVRGGYNGFSYADLAEQLGIRKPSIHHHFPTKASLVLAVVEQARSRIRAQITALEVGSPPALEQLLGYTGYWERCIRDQSDPFCLAGMLAAELPSLPPEIATSVRGHFVDLATWLEQVLTLGVKQGTIKLSASAALEAEAFMAAVYGAMLAARAFDDPRRFQVITKAAIDRLHA